MMMMCPSLQMRSFDDKIITQTFTASGDICVQLDQRLDRVQIHGVTFALLLVHIGQVLLFKYKQCKYMLLTSSLFCFMFTMVKFCGELRGTLGLCEYAIGKRRTVAEGCVSYIWVMCVLYMPADQFCNYSLCVCTELLNGVQWSKDVSGTTHA